MEYYLWCFVFLLSICRLLSIAEETLAEFLSKATGTAVEWVQMPGMKVNYPTFFYFFYLLCHLVNLFPLFALHSSTYY